MNLFDIVITSERLKLVPLSEQYATQIFPEFTEEITTFMYPRAPKKIEDTLEFIHSSLPKMKEGKEFPLVILDKNTGEFLGGTGIHGIDTRTPRFGIWIKKSAHGNKYGREAIAALKNWTEKHFSYDYIIYDVDKQNISSKKIAETLGGIPEKEYKKENMSGKILDMIEYRIYKK